MNSKKYEEFYQKNYTGKCPHLCKDEMVKFTTDLFKLLFPQRSSTKIESFTLFKQKFDESRLLLESITQCLEEETFCSKVKVDLIDYFYDDFIFQLKEQIQEDAQFILAEDPAASSLNEIIICYPGFLAIATYRLAHFFYKNDIKLFPRVLTEFAHQMTGINIHPGAKIDSPFFIDHGTGVVIGETTKIGRFVKVYQGVTLGALSVDKTLSNQKRHPTIEDYCIIYSNATILGGQTVIGAHSIIGGSVWITDSVENNSKITL